MKTQEMLRTHPRKPFSDFNELGACIMACIECGDSCNSCADACLGEEKLQMLTKCIRLNLDCADICDETAHVLSRQTEPDVQLWARPTGSLIDCLPYLRTGVRETCGDASALQDLYDLLPAL